MKKGLMLFITGILAVSLAACAGTRDPKTLYDEATKKTSELDSMEMNSVIKMQMIQGETTADISMDMNMKMSGINTEGMKYSAEGTTEASGQAFDISIYYENGYYYMITMGQKMKYAMDLNSIMEQVKNGSAMGNFQSDYLKDLTIMKEGSDQKLTFSVDSEKLDTYVQEMMSRVGADLSGTSYRIKDASGEATVNKDGYFVNSKMKMTLEMEMQGQTLSMVMDVDSTTVNPGKAVEVTTPDLEGYTEIDVGGLGQ